MVDAQTPWGPEHFIGGHPALDLANAVFDRLAPADDNELLKSAQDLANWLCASGLAADRQARWIAERSDDELLETVHAIREASFALFNEIARGRTPVPEPLGFLMATAATGLETGTTEMQGTRPVAHSEWREPHAVSSFLAMLSVNAYFTLPKDKIRSCPRCGWLFVDTSRGGRRRWCSMKTCGNREKISRHRYQPSK
jgi:predicted RNA-binding Zn ribbon-like protein